MLKTKIFSALALTLMAGAAMAQSAAPTALPSEAWLQDASGNPYCDGITGITSSGTGGYYGVYDAATYCGQFQAAAGGPAARGLKPTGMFKPGAAMVLQTAATYGQAVTVALNTDGTWGVYDQSGNLYNSGLWSATAPGLVARKAASALAPR
jgi:hypothetical protein